jgi:release factor glutamine methyltransferase
VTTVATALADARRRGVASLDAQLLLARLLATTRTRLIAHDERPLTPAEAARWEDSLARRLAGDPIAYLLGEKEFHGVTLEVDRNVLVPRPETELLVDWAGEAVAALTSERARSGDPGPIRVVDLGTGSGAIALLEASWWDGLEGRRFDIAIANPPYIAGDDPHLATLMHEPALALTPGGDGLGALRAIVAGASAPLLPGGWLFLEHGFDQAAAVRALLAAAGFAAVETRRDLAGRERATGGRRPSF